MRTQNNKNQLMEVELEIIGFMVNIAALLRMPRSVGEIFGLLYISNHPLSMNSIMEKLSISLGSASQGIRSLKSFDAIRSVYIPGERKEHFVAETDFRKLITRMMNDELKPKLDSASGRLHIIEGMLDKELSQDEFEFLRDKVSTLKRLNKRAKMIFDPISKIISL